jgi:hypothetical protein
VRLKPPLPSLWYIDRGAEAQLKEVDGAYQSGPCRVWIKVRNPARIVQRDCSENLEWVIPYGTVAFPDAVVLTRHRGNRRK